MQVWIYSLLSVLTVSLMSLLAVFFLSLEPAKLQKILPFLVSLAVGGLVGDAFIHLIPEAYEKIGNSLYTSLLILSGMLVFFLLEKFLRWRHCHIPTSEKHLHPLVTLNLVGDGVHNLIDGMLIAASYGVSIPIGITTTIAVVLHEIPQEVGDFGVLLFGGLSIKRSLLFNFLSALTAVLGAMISLTLGPHVQNYSLIMLPVTAGGFIYIGGSDLIPELQDRCENFSFSMGHFLGIVLGIGLMALLLLVG